MGSVLQWPVVQRGQVIANVAGEVTVQLPARGCGQYCLSFRYTPRGRGEIPVQVMAAEVTLTRPEINQSRVYRPGIQHNAMFIQLTPSDMRPFRCNMRARLGVSDSQVNWYLRKQPGSGGYHDSDSDSCVVQ